MIIKMGTEQMHDFNTPNEPFSIIGKIVPRYDGNEWSFTEILYEVSSLKTYQHNTGTHDEYIDNPNKVIFMSYHNGICVGRVQLRKNWNQYAFIEDIAVGRSVRGQGIGTELINKSIEWAKENDLCGIMLETQDNNLLACRFYDKLGFKIGGLDTMLNSNFSNYYEKTIYWYMKF